MGDEDNYTIDEVDESPDVEDVSDRRLNAFRPRAPAWLICGGVAVILGAAWCSTVQFNGFGQTGPSKGSIFVTALTLPLSIVGALLVVAGCLAIVVSHWDPGTDSTTDESQTV